MENEKYLTEVQWNSYITAQMNLERARQEVARREQELSTVVSLILDSHGLPLNVEASIDPQTRKLSVKSHLSPPAGGLPAAKIAQSNL